jgi:hypothetical protein
MIRYRIAVSALVFSVLLFLPAAAFSDVDHSQFSALLDLYLNDERVDYSGFKRDEARLDAYLAHLEAVDVDALNRNEQFAFYSNAYNAWTIKLILTGYPGIDSIKDLGSVFRSPWKQKLVRLNTGVFTLDEVEHDILRPRFKDPRVHFAINCAAKSCPPLYPEAFVGDRLDDQLDDATRSFINDPQQYRIEGDVLVVSRIFKWFGEDFENGPLAFFLQYADAPLKEALEARRETLTVDYLDYDWSLNAQ